VDVTGIETVPCRPDRSQEANPTNLSKVTTDTLNSYAELRRNLLRMKALMQGASSGRVVDSLVLGSEIAEHVVLLLRAGRGPEATQ
jgi:hypothetical protein